MYTKASKEASMRYNKKNYDTLLLRFPKNKTDDNITKDELKAHAEKMNESTAAFCQRAIMETIKRDNQ